MGKIVIYPVETLVNIMLFRIRENASYEDIAKKYSIEYSSVYSVIRTMKRHMEHPEKVHPLSFNKNHRIAAEKLREMLSLPPGEKGQENTLIPQEEREKPPGSALLTTLDIVKIIWLRKKHNMTFKQIASQIKRGEMTLWSCINIIDKRYWTKDFKEIANPSQNYFVATLVAKEILVHEKDPFHDDLTSLITDAQMQFQTLLASKKEPALLVDHLPNPSPHPEPVLPVPQEKESVLSELDDPYAQFEKEISSAVTKLVSSIVEKKLAFERSHFKDYKQRITTAEDETKKVTAENEALKKRNEELTRKLLQQKQTSLASSLKSSFDGNI